MKSPVGWWTHRREPERDRIAFEQPLGTPVAVQTEVELAPAPVPYTAWWNVGRDAEHSGLTRNVPRLNLAISDWLSVQGWPFLGGMKANPTSMISPGSAGIFNPQVTRVNIDTPPQTSLGMLSSIKAPETMPNNADYLKLV